MIDNVNRWYVLVISLLIAYLIYLLSPVLTPFAMGALLAYLFDPMADKLESWKLSRTVAVTIVFFVITLLTAGILLLLIPALEKQITNLITNLPVYFEWLRTHVSPWLKEKVGIETDLFNIQEVTALLKQHWGDAGGIASTVLESIGKSGAVIFNWMMNLLLIPVVTFYLLRDWDILTVRCGELIPRAYYNTVHKLVKDSNAVLGAFLRGQLSVMLALGMVYTIGLWIIGLELSLLIGMGAGLVSFVPYLGTIVGLVAGLIAALVQFGDITHIIYVLIVFGVGQALEGMILTPLLVGDRIGLHPVAVIFSVLAGAQLFGFVGVLLGLPMAAVVMVLLRYAHLKYMDSKLYGKEEDITLTSTSQKKSKKKEKVQEEDEEEDA